MEAIQITSLEQVPAGLTKLFAEIALLKNMLRSAHSSPVQTAPTEPKYRTRREAAERLHISLPTFDKAAAKGVIKGYRFGTRVLYKSVEVDTALQFIQPLIAA